MLQESNQKKQNGVKKDISKSYNQFKEFQGKNYTGMKVGRTHKWYYDKGEWSLAMMLPKEGQEMHQKVQVFLSEQSIIGTSLRTKM
jgi:hypothetical protein